MPPQRDLRFALSHLRCTRAGVPVWLGTRECVPLQGRGARAQPVARYSSPSGKEDEGKELEMRLGKNSGSGGFYWERAKAHVDRRSMREILPKSDERKDFDRSPDAPDGGEERMPSRRFKWLAPLVLAASFWIISILGCMPLFLGWRGESPSLAVVRCVGFVVLILGVHWIGYRLWRAHCERCPQWGHGAQLRASEGPHRISLPHAGHWIGLSSDAGGSAVIVLFSPPL